MMDSCFVVGSSQLLMTVTSFFIGEIVKVTHEYVELKNACWVGCTGTFKDFLAEGKVDSFDPIPATMPVYVFKQSIVNSMPWPHPTFGHNKRTKSK